jgi:hypothetical protein
VRAVNPPGDGDRAFDEMRAAGVRSPEAAHALGQRQNAGLLTDSMS